MGLDRLVTLPAGTVLAWPPLAQFLGERQLPVRLMMIDGQLSFPDEVPPDSWRELRLGTPAGMLTLRREENGVRTVVWGNAEGPLLQAWTLVTWALATLHGGTIMVGEKQLSADEFARQQDMPMASRTP